MTDTNTANVIRVAHSPDADDAFMFYALATDRVDTEGLRFEHILKDIETLNQEAAAGTYELTAISYHAYAYLHDKYAIFPVGSSIGEQYGPILVAKEPMTLEALKATGKPVAVPGTQTSAYLFLKLYCPELPTTVIEFDQIPEAVLNGKVAAGLLIHESQVTYSEEGLHKIVDLGEWWHEKTGLVLPLGCNGIRRDLGEDMIQKICRVLYRSVKWALENREEALAGCQQYARDLPPAKVDKFVGMYVNDLTLEITPEIREAVTLMLKEGYDKGLIPKLVEPEFIEYTKPASLV